MAEDLTPADQAGVEPEDELPPYQARFQLVLGVLLGIGMAAVAATVIFLATDRDEPRAPVFSTWEPTAKTGEVALRQIAEHVAAKYDLPDGRQLVSIEGQPLNSLGTPLKVSVTADDGAIKRYEDGALFTLDGDGENGAISRGKPSNTRKFVLGRESFELALYTFRYVGNIDVVVAILPPPPGEKPSRVMFFRREDLEPLLRHPLERTLPGPARPKIRGMSRGLRTELKKLTEANIYEFDIRTGLDGLPVMALERSR